MERTKYICRTCNRDWKSHLVFSNCIDDDPVDSVCSRMKERKIEYVECEVRFPDCYKQEVSEMTVHPYSEDKFSETDKRHAIHYHSQCNILFLIAILLAGTILVTVLV